MVTHKQHVQRIHQELRAAGATAYGVSKFASKHLPAVIFENEHIEAVVYGRYGTEKGLGILGMIEGMLVATDHRVIFLDRKPGYTSVDEMTYYAITGVQRVTASIFSAVTLFTRTGNYTLRFANNRCAQHFVRRIEMHHLGQTEPLYQQSAPPAAIKAPPAPTLAPTPASIQMPVLEPGPQLLPPPAPLNRQAMAFLKAHNLAVLSAIDPDGMVYGSLVYYLVTTDNMLYALAKETTGQVKPSLLHSQVALTTYDLDANQTVEVTGTGVVETASHIRDHILTTLIHLRTYYGNLRIPPADQLRQWSYVVIRVVPTVARFVDQLQPSAARLQ